MKAAIAALAFAVMAYAAPALATDYTQGQCPVSSFCFFGSGNFNTETFSDTSTFSMGDWTESYGILHYTSSSSIQVSGGRICSGGRTQSCHFVYIDTASVNGIPMNPPDTSGCPIGSAAAVCYTWSLPLSLPFGTNKVAVTGHLSATSYVPSHWAGQVNGVTYTLEPLPPCTDCGE